MLNNSIWPIDRTLLSATTSGQNRPGSDGNDRVLRVPQSFSFTEASPWDYLMSYNMTLIGVERPYSSEEIQSMHSAAPADLTEEKKEMKNKGKKQIKNKKERKKERKISGKKQKRKLNRERKKERKKLMN